MSFNLIIFLMVFIVSFIIKLPICFGMLAATVTYMVITPGPLAILRQVPLQICFNMAVKFTLIAMPLFLFMANIMNTAKITDNIFKFADVVVGRAKGGIAHVNVLASLIFSGMSGSAIVDATALGTMEIQEMRKQGFPDEFSCAITASSAVIGPIFPPSMPMIYYAMISGTSLGMLFIAGVIPGILMAILLMIYIWIISKKRHYPSSKKYLLRDGIAIAIKTTPALLTVVILLNGIYSGIVTTTEAGAIASLYAIIIAFLFYGGLTWKEFWDCMVQTCIGASSLIFILVCSFAFSYVVSAERLGISLANLVMSLTSNKYMLMLLINVVFLILGMFIDVTVIQIVFVPMILPLVTMVGIDLVTLGVALMVNIMIGDCSPPYGFLLFIVSDIADCKLEKIIKEMWPLLGVMIIELLLVSFVPALTLWLPSLMMR